MTSTSSPEPIFVWPRWAEFYGVVVAAPMAMVSWGLMIFLLWARGDIFGEPYIGAIMLMVAFLSAFFIAGLLFAGCVVRVLRKQSEAISMGSSGHLMLLLPAATLVLVGYIQQRDLMINGLVEYVDSRVFNFDVVLLAWLVIHAYFAMFLALADNSMRFVDGE